MAKYNIEKILHFWCNARSKVYTKLLSWCFFSVGANITITPPVRFNNMAQVQLGNKVTIHSNCWIQVVNERAGDDSLKLVINDGVSIGMNATISAAIMIVIEENVLLARNVFISDHEHEYKDISKPASKQGIRKVAEVRIGTNSWLGQNSSILAGVKIGRNCVVGANSVVTRDVPDYSVAVGSPARIIKTYDVNTGRWMMCALNGQDIN